MTDMWDRYTAASHGLVTAVRDGRPVDPADFDAVRAVLLHEARALGFSGDAAEDLVAETLYRIVTAVRRRNVRYDDNVAGYLRTIMRYLSLDAWRGGGRRVPAATDPADLPAAGSDDEIARLIDGLASAERVAEAMALAAADNGELASFVGEWLRIAERVGKSPSTRDVAAELGMSSSTVSRYMEMFRVYLSQVAGD